MKRLSPATALRLALVLTAWLAGPRLFATTLTLTPSSISNTFDGQVTLQVTGIAPGGTVVAQKYLDVNGNGVIDAADELIEQFTLTDGQAGMVIAGVTNGAVPGDTDATPGQITAKLHLSPSDFTQNIIGQYLVKISTATDAVTNVFTVTNFPFGQGVAGNVVSNGTSATVPYATVLLFPPPRPGHSGLGQPAGGTVANGAGAYGIQAPPGSYLVVAFRSNYVTPTAAAPLVTVTAGVTLTTNLSLSNATTTISGRVVDAANANVGLPGLFVTAQGNGLLAVGGTDSNGFYSMAVQPGSWKLNANGASLNDLGYVTPSGNASANAGDSGVILSYAKANALVYGRVTNNLGQPLAGIDLFAQDNNNSGQSLYDLDTFSDANGNYVAAIVGGLGDNDLWQVEVSNDNNPTNYLFSQPSFDQTGASIAAGTALLANFNAIVVTHHITGTVTFNGAPVTGAQVSANLEGSPDNFRAQTDTDGAGHYDLLAANGTWSVSLTCQGGNDSLDNVLGGGNYFCPDAQDVTILNNDSTADFAVQAQSFDAQLSGRVVDDLGNPVANMNLFAFPNGGNGAYFGATTDQNGNYQMGIDAGDYDVELNSDPSSGAASVGLVSPFIPVTISAGNDVSGMNLVARHGTGSIFASITNSGNAAGVAGIFISGSAALQGTNYVTVNPATDANGKTTLLVCNGQWRVTPDCHGLNNLGFPCVNGQDINIVNNNGAANFLVATATVLRPRLGSLAWAPGQFQFGFSGATNQLYTVQISTNLSSAWVSIFTTNSAASGSFNLTDPQATNQQRFYRVKVGGP
ncbi:MAG TPA: carboxypeptidase regulatory-like domain-containing protein [Verrucomicrobiae bacterium]|jgi:hypothetical protein|nr:carboxypeptidase regulatory-like domain-containing protein [Verrucomicrobiae bacterium]